MKPVIASLIVAGALIVGAFMLRNSNGSGVVLPDVPVNNVSVVDGTQVIEIVAKGGYQPRKSTAKAGIPTVLRLNTKGTFDCSLSVRIPSLGISKNLPVTGSTDVELGVNKPGVLYGTCGMGMYPFEIDFQG